MKNIVFIIENLWKLNVNEKSKQVDFMYMDLKKICFNQYLKINYTIITLFRRKISFIFIGIHIFWIDHNVLYYFMLCNFNC